MRDLSTHELDDVAGAVTQRPDGGTCTDPFPLPGPWWPFPPLFTADTLS